MKTRTYNKNINEQVVGMLDNKERFNDRDVNSLMGKIDDLVYSWVF